jgi:hypothetical protein
MPDVEQSVTAFSPSLLLGLSPHFVTSLAVKPSLSTMNARASEEKPDQVVLE